ncbi:phosphoserine phosphatase, partial [Vibrio alginolyticus]
MYATSETNKTIKSLALFDFDGTLCSKDSFTGFIFYALSKRHIVKQGLKILPWIQAYYLNFYPAHAMRAKLFRSMFKDTPAIELQRLGEEYAQELVSALSPEIFTQLQHHQLRGDQVVLVSASIDVYLAPLCKLLDIELICTETQIKNGRMTGYYSTPDCSSEQKKLRIHQQYMLQ